MGRATPKPALQCRHTGQYNGGGWVRSGGWAGGGGGVGALQKKKTKKKKTCQVSIPKALSLNHSVPRRIADGMMGENERKGSRIRGKEVQDKEHREKKF